MKKIKKVFSIVLIIALTLTGCVKINLKENFPNKKFFDNETENVYQALLKSTYSKSNLNLIAPKNGDHQTCITTFQNELNQTLAIVFYKTEDDYKTEISNELRIAILQKNKNDKWDLKINKPCDGYDVDEVILAKNKNNPNYFLIVGYILNNSHNSTHNTLTNYKACVVYDLDLNNFHRINFQNNSNYLFYTLLNYKAMKLYNLNKDENKLIIVSADYYPNTPKIVSLNSFDLLKNVIKKEKESATPLQHAHFYEIKIDYKSFEKPILFVDEKIENNSPSSETNYYFKRTEVFENKDNKLNKIFTSNMESFQPPCFDIDNDGKIEIPEIQVFAGYKLVNNECKMIKTNTLISNPPLITNWHKLVKSNEKITSTITKTYTDISHAFGFVLPPTWSNENIYAIRSDKQKSIEFYEYDPNSINNKNLKNKRLLTIIANNSNQPPKPEFFLLKSNGPFFFWAKIYYSNAITNKNLLISKQQLENSFFIMKG